MGGENANFCTSDPTLYSVLPSVVLVSPLGDANVADDGKYLTPKGKFSDMYDEILNRVLLVE
jgi:hypothetical protein